MQPSEWHIVKTGRPNALIMGAADAVEQCLAALLPHLDSPVCLGVLDTVLSSADEVRTCVIRDVHELSEDQQQRLSSWLEQAANRRVRVVSTTTLPLFQLVVAGLFREALYYRLNTVLLDIRRQTTCRPAVDEWLPPDRADLNTRFTDA
jgi:hypothetical protein